MAVYVLVRRITLCALLLLVVGWGDVYAKSPYKKIENQKWVKVTTDHFIVISDKGKKATFKLAEQLDMFRNSYLNLWGKTDKNGLENALPVKVIATKSQEIYDVLKADRQLLGKSGGMFTNSLGGNYVVIKLGKSRKKSTRVLFHEYVHYLAANTLDEGLPLWYSEGLAEFLSTVFFENNKVVKFGAPIPRHLININRMSWMPLEKMLKMTNLADMEPKERYQIYSQGWLIVHYFQTNDEQRENFNQFIDLLTKGRNIDEAFASSFNYSYQQLSAKLKEYAMMTEYSFWRWTLKEKWQLKNYQIEKLPTEEALFELGEYQLYGRSNSNSAHLLFQKAFEINPEHQKALAGLASILMENDLIAAEALISEAKSLDPENEWVSTIQGHIFFKKLLKTKDITERKEYWNQAMRAYNRALDSDQMNLKALVSVADMYGHACRSDKNLELLQIAQVLAPVNLDIRLKLIVHYAQLKQMKKANAVMDKIRSNYHMTETFRKSVEQWFEMIQSKSSNGLCDRSLLINLFPKS